MPRRLVSLLLLLALPALATTLVAMDVPALTHESDRVVRARVATVSSQRSAAGRITTVVALERLETWTGTDAPELRMLVPGGVVDGVGQRVEGAPTFAPGEEVVLFLAAHGPAFQPVGLAQGVWRVDRSDPESPRVRPDPLDGVRLVSQPGAHAGNLRAAVTLDHLRAEVRASAGR